MKHLGILALLSAALFATAPASAQSSGGLLMDRDIVTPSDLFELSQTTFSLGTARSMAMAGAFTSLGADLTSMAINPAGLGMYRHNEISITPLMSFARAENNAPAFNSNSKNRFSIGNFGFTANVYEGSGPLVSVNIGFGYNRLQDLNYQYSYYTQGNVSSIADVFSDMLQYSGINRDQITAVIAGTSLYTSLDRISFVSETVSYNLYHGFYVFSSTLKNSHEVYRLEIYKKETLVILCCIL